MPDIQSFRRRLAETIAWCGERGAIGRPRDSLRTPALCPSVLDESRYCRYQWNTRLEQQSSVDALAEERARLLTDANQYPSGSAADLGGGRLLVFDPDDTLSDGCAEEETRGFFDADNTPPWDTWICFVRERDRQPPWTPFDSYLISWVPPSFLELADDGISLNPEECIRWAEELDAPFIEQLRAEGFLLAR